MQDGVVVSIGHTKASSEQIAEAVSAGATMSTHLGNGAHLVLARHPNYIWDQMAEDRLTASFIVDGIHECASIQKQTDNFFFSSRGRVMKTRGAFLVPKLKAPSFFSDQFFHNFDIALGRSLKNF